MYKIIVLLTDKAYKTIANNRVGFCLLKAPNEMRYELPRCSISSPRTIWAWRLCKRTNMAL